MDSGTGVTRRAAFVRFGGVLASGMLASACGVSRVGDVAGSASLTATVPPRSGRSSELLWYRRIGGIVSLAVSGDTVSYGAEGGGVDTEALDAATGKPLWSTGVGFKPPVVAFAAGGGMVLGGGVYADGDDNITALSAATGHLLWSVPADVGNPNGGTGPWLIFADNAVFAFIGLPGSHAVYRDEVVLALDGQTGARKWMSRLPPMSKAMAVGDGVVYAGSSVGPPAAGEVVALEGATGARRWTARVGAPVAALVVTGGAVIGC